MHPDDNPLAASSPPAVTPSPLDERPTSGRRAKPPSGADPVTTALDLAVVEVVRAFLVEAWVPAAVEALEASRDRGAGAPAPHARSRTDAETLCWEVAARAIDDLTVAIRDDASLADPDRALAWLKQRLGVPDATGPLRGPLLARLRGRRSPADARPRASKWLRRVGWPDEGVVEQEAGPDAALLSADAVALELVQWKRFTGTPMPPRVRSMERAASRFVVGRLLAARDRPFVATSDNWTQLPFHVDLQHFDLDPHAFQSEIEGEVGWRSARSRLRRMWMAFRKKRASEGVIPDVIARMLVVRKLTFLR